MPLYEYSCRKCATIFEALFLPGRETTLTCPSCSSTDVERQISLFAVDSESTRKANLEAGRRHLEPVGAALRDLYLERPVLGRHGRERRAVAGDLDDHPGDRPLAGRDDGPADHTALLGRPLLLPAGGERGARDGEHQRGGRAQGRNGAKGRKAARPLRPFAPLRLCARPSNQSPSTCFAIVAICMFEVPS